MFDESLERVYLELLRIHVHGKRNPTETGASDRSELAWDLMNDLERLWPDKVQEISDRYKKKGQE